MVPSAPSGHETPFLSSLTLGRFIPGSDQKRSGRVVADVCSPSYRFVWQIDRTYAVASQIS